MNRSVLRSELRVANEEIKNQVNMRVWFISDTHCEHSQLEIPDVDLVIHCGDESNSGTVWVNERESRNFFDWFSGLEIVSKIFVPGNHSTAFEKGMIRASDYPEIKFLVHEETEWMGLKIFGSPFTPQFFNWAYMKLRPELEPLWQMIPYNTDILITHGPPKGILDVTRDFNSGVPIHVGSKSLRRHVENRIKPMIHAFGHIHDEQGISNFGKLIRQSTQYINCSVCDTGGDFKNQGLVIDISVDRSE